MTVKIEGKNVHLLGDSMLNNCGPSGSPPNTGATMLGTDHASSPKGRELVIKCEGAKDLKGEDFSDCEREEICAKIAAVNAQMKEKGGLKQRRKRDKELQRDSGNKRCAEINEAARAGTPPPLKFHDVSPDCEQKLRAKAEKQKYKGFSADHFKDVKFVGGLPINRMNLRWMSSNANSWIGFKMTKRLPGKPKYKKVSGDCCK
jgi:hypothetical protein